MELLDEEGRLFGAVNVVDALVVVFALAVVVAGAALVFGGGDDASGETMHVTLVSENASATALEAGEVGLESGTLAGTGRDATATVTDVYRTAGPRVYLRVALEGSRTDDEFRYEDEPVRLGDRVVVADDTARATTRLVERDVDRTFSPTTTPVTVATTVRRPVADAVAAGDEVTVGSTAVATVTDVEATARNDSHTDLRVTLDLRTRTVDGTPHYGGRPVRLGRELGVGTDDYEFEGAVVDRE
ncbi:DUF4330 family protein [Natronomonas marina]|uniref:DUF4330 family protein n=1 Tax=Natronomonas marina TaxID=2961939 RepID=UPI0020C95580|nr:DUF4330 family protein [Natronomonas marina]